MGKRDQNATAELFKDATLEDIASNPTKYGAPTFEQFTKNYEKYVKHNTEDGKLGILDNGPTLLRKYTRKIVWVVGGVKCKTPEMCVQVAADKNIDLRKYSPQLVDVGGGKHDIHMIFNTEKQPDGKIVGLDGRRLSTS